MTANPFVILYVEDNDLVRESFAELLATGERRVVCVADGAGAREALREQNVNLLITDINLPDGSGLDVAREALRQNPRLPVIVCSGHDLGEATRSLGPTAHPLRKPFDLDELEALVERLAQLAT
jgi:CheY-like chemotaxis protein